MPAKSRGDTEESGISSVGDNITQRRTRRRRNSTVTSRTATAIRNARRAFASRKSRAHRKNTIKTSCSKSSTAESGPSVPCSSLLTNDEYRSHTTPTALSLHARPPGPIPHLPTAHWETARRRLVFGGLVRGTLLELLLLDSRAGQIFRTGISWLFWACPTWTRW